jgi:hypothetical protein
MSDIAIYRQSRPGKDFVDGIIREATRLVKVKTNLNIPPNKPSVKTTDERNLDSLFVRESGVVDVRMGY